MSDPAAMIRAVLNDPSMPGGDGSVPALQSAIAALSRGDHAGAHAALWDFQRGARHTPDFTSKGDSGILFPGGSGDDVFTRLRQAVLGAAHAPLSGLRQVKV